jgi:hypothetical protein
MLVTFKSKAWSSIIMTRDVAVTLLKMAGHSGTVPSALLAADIPAALARLNQGLAAAEPADRKTQEVAARAADEAGEPPPVGIRLRAFPLIQMLTAAAGRGEDVTWEEGAPVV